MSPRRGPRIVLALGIVVGVANAAAFPLLRPEQVGIATDVYYRAAVAALSGGDFYAVTPPGQPAFRFLYPPIVVLAFVPHALVGSPLRAYLLQTAINLLTAGLLAAVTLSFLRATGVDLAEIDRALIAGFAFGWAPAATTLVLGQVNHQLALAVALGFVWLERDRERLAGVAFGLAALLKLFPALLGAWLLRRRSWTAIATATGTGLGALALGVAVFGPGTTATYFTGVIPGEASVASFARGPDPSAPYATIRRQLAYLFPELSAEWFLPLGALLLAPVVLATYRRVDDTRGRLAALQATLLAILTLLPLEGFYLSIAFFPTASLLYLIEGRTARRAYLAGVLLASLPLAASSVDVVATLLGLPPGLVAPLRAFVRDAFAFALPATYGTWLMLLGCVSDQWRR